MENAECCPQFNPDKWNEKTFNWDNKPFIKDSIPTLFHMPFPPMVGSKIGKMCKMAEESGKNDPNKEECLIVFYDPSAFRSEIFVSVTGVVPGANNVALTGTFMSKVFDGPFSAAPKNIKLMDEYLAQQDKKAKDYYIHYAYCPKCVEKFGHNYSIIFAKV